uniref:Reticulon-like protein n=1 Tax=Davidia involucrata TaxID=16924 RepID=A0A5B6ZHE7_DAVIN
MELGRRKSTTRNGVVAGSVWESRMKIDEVKGGIKVFNGEENSEENGDTNSGPEVDKKLRAKQSIVGVSGKRKTWKSEGFERNPIQIAKQRSELNKNLDDRSKELSVSADGIKKSPIQTKKTRSEVGKELSVSVDGIERSPSQKMKARSEEAKELSVSVDGIQSNPIQIRKSKSESCKEVSESGNGIERNSIQLRKVKSESNKALDGSVDGNEGNSIQLRKVKSVSNKSVDQSDKNLDRLSDETERSPVELRKVELDSNKAVDESTEGFNASVEGIEKSPDGIRKTRSDETCKEFDVCQEKVISSSLSNVGQVKSAPQLVVTDDDDDCVEEYWDGELEEEVDEEIEIEKKSLEIKEINIPEQKPKKVVIEEKKFNQDQKKEEKKSNQIHEKPLPISPILKKQPPPVVKHPRIYPNPTKTTQIPVSEEFQRAPETHNRLQSLVDLVMWRDVSKSAFVFGIGTFVIVSSSYTKDLNISFITVMSYLGLVYLALIFLYRTIICRGAVYIDDTSQSNVLGEEEAVWLLKLVLPYLNEFLLKLRALFSGDPATTMKLAVLLFVLARCGSSITIWKMAKLGFFGVFTVPKVCSSYSTQLTAYGKFWVRRIRDAWESCSQKKAVACVIFTLVWNLSSIVARIWAVFMLLVAFRYYQQSLLMRDDWVEEEAGGEASWQGQVGGHRKGRGPTLVEIKKTKKGS